MEEELEELEELEKFPAVGDLKRVFAGSDVTILRLSVGINSELMSVLWRMSWRKSETAVTLLITFLFSEGNCVTEMASCFARLRSSGPTV